MRRLLRTASLAIAGIGSLLFVITVDRQLDSAGETEPAWLSIRVENQSEAELRLLGMTLLPALQHPEAPAWPIVLAPITSPDRRWVSGLYSLDTKAVVLELVLRRADDAASETHTLRIQPRQGGICHAMIDVLSQTVVSDACSMWTPTYGGWPH